ncbi:SusC/RagA family TonB-linked outer membrane protein [Chitinophaga rhizosphaerae]|uniref:SusC/RagA family TonB-linked outer membrane protein n=1 Tax=Chitinophaga rhizosphaerae TaxID=1864947 RepID=UPI000F7FF736|nr:SusC/RagA family TonB-linked outer membrane protein [Chitinophaga rhizosphaerae]
MKTSLQLLLVAWLTCFTGSASLAQSTNVLKGLVNDEAGAPVIGASVTVINAGTNFTAGTKTDSLGVFRFANLPPGGPYSVIITSIGFQGQTLAGYMIKPDANISLLAKLKISAADIDEVVVVGYGSQKKVNLSGAVQSVSGDALQNRSISNVNSGMQGLIPNLEINPGSGRATDAATFNVRGVASISGASAPLILVDNVPITSEELSLISPADIENMTVLKDAGAAAIYGARAAFGVVLITTKSAKNSKLQMAANFNYGIKQNTDAPKIVTEPLTVMQYKRAAGTPLYSLFPDAEQAYAKELRNNPDLPRVFQVPGSRFWTYYGSTDWLAEIYNKYAPAYTGDVSVSKKDNKMAYYLSAGYYRQEGSLKYGNDIMDRYNLRAKATFTPTKWLSFGSNTSYIYRTYDSPTFLDGYLFWSAARTSSLSVPKNPDGSWTRDGAALLGSLQGGGRTSNDINDFQTTFNTKINLLSSKWTFYADATFRRSNDNSRIFNRQVYYRTGPDEPLLALLPQSPLAISTSSYASNSANRMRMNVYNVYTDFQQTFAKKHYVKALVGFNQEYRYFNDFSSTRLGLITPDLPSPQLATGVIQPPTDLVTEYALRGFFYRLNYIYNNKYIVELNARNDGTSRFREDDRWGFFPSASASWVASRERFLDPLFSAAKISLFKLRASYGTLGNQVLSSNPRVNNYPYYTTMPAGPVSYILDGGRPPGVSAPRYILPEQTWEEATSLNLGADVSFFKDKLQVNFDAYTRRTTGMLVKSKTLPAIFGTAEPRTNAADLKTKGWELSVAWRDGFDVAGKRMNVSARLSLSNSKAFITRYDNPAGILTDYYVGQQIGEMWGMISDGFFQTQEELAALDQSAVGAANQQSKFYVGDLRFKDLNGDKRIDMGNNTLYSKGDLVIIGNNRPQFPYSLDLNSNWNGIDLRLYIQGVGKRDWYPPGNHIYYWGIYAQPWTNVLESSLDHWTPENRDAYYPRVKGYIAERNNQELAMPQTKYLEDASYCRLKNVTIGYSLPRSLMTKWGLSAVRVYVSGENLYTYKKMRSNLDPEAINYGGGAGYPLQKTYSCGINLNF